jgi:hypothetical protein
LPRELVAAESFVYSAAVCSKLCSEFCASVKV